MREPLFIKSVMRNGVPAPENHEPIKDLQKTSSQPFDDLSPSEVHEVYWLYARNRTGNYPSPTPRSGKWLLFVPKTDIDKVWARVKEATETGRLGADAKVSTAKPNPNEVNPTDGVICVYTYDSDDERDVMRVREELRALGFTNKIPYKTDEATLSGKYRRHGERKISKYYC